MYARVARWEGLDQEAIRQFAQMINSSEGPPEGVPSSGILVLSDADNGRFVGIGVPIQYSVDGGATWLVAQTQGDLGGQASECGLDEHLPSPRLWSRRTDGAPRHDGASAQA